MRKEHLKELKLDFISDNENVFIVRFWLRRRNSGDKRRKEKTKSQSK